MDVKLDLAKRAIECVLCVKRVMSGELRVTEGSEYGTGLKDEQRTKLTYTHFACCVDLKPDLAYAALIQRNTDPATLKAALELVRLKNPKLHAEAAAFRAKHYPVADVKETNSLDDPTTQELLDELEATPDSREVLAVLSDHLQQMGDPRGELLAIDLAGSVDLERANRRRALREALKPPLERHCSFEWGMGFVRSLSLRLGHGLAVHAPTLLHPSCRLLTSLELEIPSPPQPTALAMDLLPRSLRTLKLVGPILPVDLSPLGHLRSLEVDERAHVRHATVGELRLHLVEDQPLEIVPAHFPAVKKIILGIAQRPERLIDAGWLAHIEALHLGSLFDTTKSHVDLVGVLEAGGHRLSVIVIGGIIDESLLVRLRAVGLSIDHSQAFIRNGALLVKGEQLDLSQAHIGNGMRIVKEEQVRHLKKPEWGVGKVVRRFEGKVEIVFGTTTRIFPVDSPLLKFE